jgi:hypothetical protein
MVNFSEIDATRFIISGDLSLILLKNQTVALDNPVGQRLRPDTTQLVVKCVFSGENYKASNGVVELPRRLYRTNF